MGRAEYLERMVALANTCQGYVLAPETLRMYEKLLVPKLGWDKICQSLEQILLTRKSRDPFPSMQEILALHQGSSDPEQLAILAANRLAEAVAKDGHTNAQRARERMGELAWAVVQMEGGWVNLCQKLPAGDVTHFRHQWTKTALAIQRAGPHNLRPALPQPRREQAALPQGGGDFSSVGNVLKQLADGKEG